MVATANAKLRDATEQLRDVLLHRLRIEARVGDMEKRLEVVKENRQKHAGGGWCFGFCRSSKLNTMSIIAY